MKYSVCVSLNYVYDVEIPDGCIENKDDIVPECDSADPVYSDLMRVLTDNHVYGDGITTSIVDENGEIIYCVGE